MSAECERAAAWSLPATRSGRSPFATRTSFIAPRILFSDARENAVPEAAETTESATTIAAQSAATCVGERIGGHSEGSLRRLASPKWGIPSPKLLLNANFCRAEFSQKRLLRARRGGQKSSGRR